MGKTKLAKFTLRKTTPLPERLGKRVAQFDTISGLHRKCGLSFEKLSTISLKYGFITLFSPNITTQKL